MKAFLIGIITITATVILSLSPAAAQKKSTPKQVTFAGTDSAFYNGQWAKARDGYESLSKQHPEKITALTWNRLGYSYHNLGSYHDAIKNYEKAHKAKPSAALAPYLASRLARAYAHLNNKTEALAWLDSAVRHGYSALNEMDTLADYNSIRNEDRFKKYYATIRTIAYPCEANPKFRDFDFWVGEWDVYQTGTSSPRVGRSVVQRIAGGCALLENWTALLATGEGKSINYYDNAAKSWEQDWMGSDGNVIKFTEGVYKEGVMQFKFDAIQPDGKKLPGRFRFFNVGKNEVRQFSEQSSDDGKTWVANYDFTYIRKANQSK